MRCAVIHAGVARYGDRRRGLADDDGGRAVLVVVVGAARERPGGRAAWRVRERRAEVQPRTQVDAADTRGRAGGAVRRAVIDAGVASHRDNSAGLVDGEVLRVRAAQVVGRLRVTGARRRCARGDVVGVIHRDRRIQSAGTAHRGRARGDRRTRVSEGPTRARHRRGRRGLGDHEALIDVGRSAVSRITRLRRPDRAGARRRNVHGRTRHRTHRRRLAGEAHGEAGRGRGAQGDVRVAVGLVRQCSERDGLIVVRDRAGSGARRADGVSSAGREGQNDRLVGFDRAVDDGLDVDLLGVATAREGNGSARRAVAGGAAFRVVGREGRRTAHREVHRQRTARHAGSRKRVDEIGAAVFLHRRWRDRQSDLGIVVGNRPRRRGGSRRCVAGTCDDGQHDRLIRFHRTVGGRIDRHGDRRAPCAKGDSARGCSECRRAGLPIVGAESCGSADREVRREAPGRHARAREGVDEVRSSVFERRGRCHGNRDRRVVIDDCASRGTRTSCSVAGACRDAEHQGLVRFYGRVCGGVDGHGRRGGAGRKRHRSTGGAERRRTRLGVVRAEGRGAAHREVGGERHVRNTRSSEGVGEVLDTVFVD